jgi:hypothetical protein
MNNDDYINGSTLVVSLAVVASLCFGACAKYVQTDQSTAIQGNQNDVHRTQPSGRPPAVELVTNTSLPYQFGDSVKNVREHLPAGAEYSAGTGQPLPNGPNRDQIRFKAEEVAGLRRQLYVVFDADQRLSAIGIDFIGDEHQISEQCAALERAAALKFGEPKRWEKHYSGGDYRFSGWQPPGFTITTSWVQRQLLQKNVFTCDVMTLAR